MPINRGLVPLSSWCWRILEVVASYVCNLLIYIRNCFVVFSHLGFHVKLLCNVFLWLYAYGILTAIISDKLLIS
jgi:hypothetical protein